MPEARIMQDIVFIESNEQEFVEMAKRLGYSELCFVGKNQKQASDGAADANLKIKSAAICTKRIEKADVVLLNSNNRSLIKKRPDYVFGIEGKRDSMHKRDSGLDVATVKEMKQFGVGYAINFSEILDSDDREGLLGRIMQNIMLCKKYKVPIKIFSFAKQPLEMRNLEDLKAFARVLGFVLK
ncbi:hypothetical protein KY311_01585 [Candidatus Woesearchaeota archaeon]|nr:hypothetical protein [Candidatus Woesearchaeota archaeon]